jgi:hypothetical protein
LRTGLFTDSNGVRVELPIEELLNLQQTLSRIDGTTLDVFIREIHRDLKAKFDNAYMRCL